jgi:hypothetical protein
MISSVVTLNDDDAGRARAGGVEALTPGAYSGVVVDRRGGLLLLAVDGYVPLLLNIIITWSLEGEGYGGLQSQARVYSFTGRCRQR